MSPKKKTSGKRLSNEDLLQHIVALFNKEPNKYFNYRQVSHALGLEKPEQKQRVYEMLATMAQQDFLTETTPGRYRKKIVAPKSQVLSNDAAPVKTM